MAHVLMERETVDGEACEALLENRWEEYLVKEQEENRLRAEAEEAAKAEAAAKLAAEAAAAQTRGSGLTTASAVAFEQGDVVLTGDLPKAPTVYDSVDDSDPKTRQARDRSEHADADDAS